MAIREVRLFTTEELIRRGQTKGGYLADLTS